MAEHRKNGGYFLSGTTLAQKLLRARGLGVDLTAGCMRAHAPGWVVAEVTERDGGRGVRYVNTKAKTVQKEAP